MDTSERERELQGFPATETGQEHVEDHSLPFVSGATPSATTQELVLLFQKQDPSAYVAMHPDGDLAMDGCWNAAQLLQALRAFFGPPDFR